MQYMESVFSLMFFSVFFFYLFLGIYIIKSNPKASINKLFLFMCLALSIWSFSFGMANSALNFESALFWRRVSAIGWTIMHSLTLHFLILLTCREKTNNKKRKLLFLHIPAVISMYVFSFSHNMSLIQYNLVKTSYGWTNIASNNFHDWFFNVYYALYTIIGLILLWNWGRKSKDKNTRNQVTIIFGAILISLILGSLTDIVPNGTFLNPLPQMSPIFIIFPIYAMYYSTKYYNLMKSENINKDEVILTKETTMKLFIYIELSFYIGGLIFFFMKCLLLENLTTSNFTSIIVKSSILFLIGIVFSVIRRIKNQFIRETLIIIGLISSIPIISFQFLDSNFILWILPIITILISLVFKKNTLMISAVIIGILTQRVLWILKPAFFLDINKFHYISRIAIFIVAYFIANNINNIFITKVKTNTHQINFQKMNSQLSYDFININKENFHDTINNFLSKIGAFFEVDRTYLFLINHEDKTVTCSHEWCSDEVDEEIYIFKEIPLQTFQWVFKEFELNNSFYISNVNKIPKELTIEQQHFINKKLKSLLLVPVIGKKKIQGFIGLDSIKSFRFWSDENIKLLNSLSNLIAKGIIQKNYDEKIASMAYYDNLTNLPNRFLFSNRLNQAIEQAKRNKEFIAVIFIDLDDFKSINDAIGHFGGDLALKYVAENLTKNLRTTDTVSRFGGDEFVVMLNNIKDLNNIEDLVKKLILLFTKTFDTNGQEFLITGSTGVAIYPMDGEDSETLIKNADTAMYGAKAKGKNQYMLCTQFMKDEVMTNMLLSNDLYRALERNEFQVYYQPQIDLPTGNIMGVEALLRWMHPKRGMISPNIFIPLAEKNGLINSIGQWVLKTACIQNKKWQDMGLDHIKMCVNLSGTQFINPNLSNDVERILKETFLDPQYLELEITENIALKEPSYVLKVLNRLKKIGISIAIDDFGTEYSSFSRLKILPIDMIKIDMQFVQGIEKDKKDRAITKIIINLAKNLGITVLAEGVETKEQLDFLNKKRCNYIQGYYYYKPMPSDEMEEVLKSIESKESVANKKLSCS